MAARWIPEHLEAEAFRALQAEYRHQRLEVFRNRMQPCTLALVDGRGFLGRWRPPHRVIEIERSFFVSAPWLETVEVLRHEMAHQLVDEVLEVHGEPDHGPSFTRVCAELGIDGRASGRPEPGVRSASPLLRRVEKLLALGGSDQRNEAEAAMRKAQALIRTHNLRAIGGSDGGPGSGGRWFTFRQLGQPVPRIEEYMSAVSAILTDAFFVETIWVNAFNPRSSTHEGMVLEVSGTPENLDIAEYVHGFLHDTAERSWRAYKEETGISGHARRRYLAGVMAGFAEQLHAERAGAPPEERALVLAGDPELHRYCGRRHPRVRRGGARRVVVDETRAAGVEAGRKIVLHRAMEGRGSGSGRLLDAGRGE